ncbi:hypothetical protein OG568_54930 (plasmid) [Streptomyces sp. NBC_01450]|uniref:glycoside hydrolase family 78 protein n=1 Tax=Streptomyces sp. NBC_01450 TaxID=2903871 RepID=UPI002E32CB6D|nr:hypothetical protein [Streptomyces sp. NBC_01450]
MHNAPYNLDIDSGGNDFPVSGPTPRLSWKPPSDAARPVAYEVECSVDGKTRPVVSTAVGGHRFVPWPSAALDSGRRVTWRVRALGTDGDSPWSRWHAFETGLLDADWQARWISPAETDDAGYGRRPAYVLSARFEARASLPHGQPASPGSASSHNSSLSAMNARPPQPAHTRSTPPSTSSTSTKNTRPPQTPQTEGTIFTGRSSAAFRRNTARSAETPSPT